MQKYVRKWLVSIALNIVWLLLSIGLMYVASVVAVLQLSTRGSRKDPMFDLINYELLVILVALIAVWLVFRFIGKIYTLITTPPKPD